MAAEPLGLKPPPAAAARSILSEPKAPSARPREQERSARTAFRKRIRAPAIGDDAGNPADSRALADGPAERIGNSVRAIGASASAPRRHRPDSP